jgi:hypothetical protein
MSDNVNTRNDKSMNNLNTVSKAPNVWPTNETHLSVLFLFLVIVTTGYVSCIPSGRRLLYFMGLCRRLGCRFLVIGWSIGLSSRVFKKEAWITLDARPMSSLLKPVESLCYESFAGASFAFFSA